MAASAISVAHTEEKLERFDPQAERISNFIHETQASAAHNLRSLTGLAAGQMTGALLGSIIMAPVAMKTGNLYYLTGGAAVLGGLMALGGSKLATTDFGGSKTSIAGDLAVLAGGGIKALPSIAYPTVGYATAAEKSMVYGAMDRLPLSGVTSVPTIDMVTGLQKAGASGLATPIFSQSRIFLDRDEIALMGAEAPYVPIHEVGHTFDFSKGIGPVLNRSQRGGGFGKAPSVSDYAETNRMEDYAESYAHYHTDPKKLLQAAPKKFEVIDQSQQPGLMDKALDRPAVREVGKKIGSAFEVAPRVRNAAALAVQLAPIYQLYRGASNLGEAIQSGDRQLLFESKMQLASGAALLYGPTAPLGLALLATQMVVSNMQGDGKLQAKQADAIANGSLVVATGPLGFTASSITQRLNEAGMMREQTAPVPMGTKDSNSLILGFVAGSVASGLVSTCVPNLSPAILAATTGLGGLLGAGLGLVHQAMTNQPTRGGLHTEDKALLAKLVAPSVVGGLGGAVAGGWAGRAAGQFLGQALAGPAGGVTGAALGQYAGVLTGSYALSQAGSHLGSHWAGLKQQAPAA